MKLNVQWTVDLIRNFYGFNELCHFRCIVNCIHGMSLYITFFPNMPLNGLQHPSSLQHVRFNFTTMKLYPISNITSL